MKSMIVLLAVLPLTAACKEVSLAFEVCDDEGRPLPRVNIESYTRERPKVPHARSKSVRTSCQTGADGRARVSINTWEGFVNCHFKCEGYYPENLRDLRFGSHFDAKLNDTVIDETEKAVAVKMRRKINPKLMIFHLTTAGTYRYPTTDRRIGYDLMKGDWVKPIGHGEVADFQVTRDWHEDAEGIVCSGTIEFTDPGSGAYVVRKLPFKEFPIDYQAKTNAVYQNVFRFSYRKNKRTGEREETKVMSDDEYMVLRTRTRVDAQGRVTKANYSHIQGPVAIARYFSLGTWYCNPTVNDTNLEYIKNESLKP